MTNRCSGITIADGKCEPTGIVFGGAHSLGLDNFQFFVRGEQSLFATLLIDSRFQAETYKFKADELRKLRDAITKAIEWLERDRT